MVYLLETAKGRLARGLPGYRTSDVDSVFDGVLAGLRRGEPLSPEEFRLVTFRLSRWRAGYAPQDVGRLIGELAQLTAGPAPEGMPLAARKLIDRIRGWRFATTHRA